jgi:nucleoside-diphosphate-sugar epimerase
MTRVLVTGASGFIGAHVVKYFLEKTDWSLIVPVTFRHNGEPIRLAESLKLYPERLNRGGLEAIPPV